MSNPTTTTTTPNEHKPGFLARLLGRLDKKLKDQAEQQSKKGSCCGGDGQGGKCC